MLKMKFPIGSLVLILLSLAGQAQFYYKDIIVTKETADRWKLYRANKVRSVRLSSFENDGQPSEGFEGDQEVAGDLSLINTHTKSSRSADSRLMAWYSPQGLPTRTEDTSDTYRSVSEYQYDQAGRLKNIINTSIETDNKVQAEEQHQWHYTSEGKPSSMWKIKNGSDTTIVRFVADEKGNIAEEHATRNNTELPTVYYYYDADNRLTDIVRYNMRAQKLLPDYIFEYAPDGKPVSMLMLPEQNSSEYQKWVYEYNDKGLKIKESCFNKRRELMGMVEYSYK
jgi:YD repeat-containing protein